MTCALKGSQSAYVAKRATPTREHSVIRINIPGMLNNKALKKKTMLIGFLTGMHTISR